MSSTKFSNTHISYKPDIDGLRGVAIIFVVLYHFFPKIFIGGFTGVDIFFVISGYLITSIIYKSIQNDAFSFVDFYVRRIKRIFPALITVLVACLIFGWITLTADEYKSLGKHTKYSTLFYTNFLLLKETGYFDKDILLKPLAHLWSLAIEEQFYIIWPFLLWFAYQTRIKVPNLFIFLKRKINILALCLVLIIISYYYNIHHIHKYPTQVFYLPWYRFWELLSGGLLAYISLNSKNYRILSLFNQSNFSVLLKNLLSIIAISLAIIILFKLNKNLFPGKKALRPIFIAISIIAISQHAFINKHILSSKLLVWVGLISYPLYLWHWPILSFINILGGGSRTELIPIALLLSILLAFLTYRFIENPIRYSKSTRLVPIVLLTLFIVIGLIGHIISRNKGFPKRYANTNPIPYIALNFWTDKDFKSWQQSRLTNLQNSSTINNIKFLILGDSHAASLIYGLYTNDESSTFGIWIGGCLPFFNYVPLDFYMDKSNTKVCIPIIQNAIKAIDTIDSIEYVVLFTRVDAYLNPDIYLMAPINNSTTSEILNPKEVFIKEYINTIHILHNKGKKVIFVIDYPDLGVNPDCANNNLNRMVFSLSTHKKNGCFTEISKIQHVRNLFLEIANTIKQAEPDILIYDAWSAFCNDLYCSHIDPKTTIPYFFDKTHLNYYGSDALAKNFLEWLAKQQ